jgi:hypothetical protein
MIKIFLYKREGKREDYTEEYDKSVYKPPFLKGEQHDVAICRAENKEAAIEIFKGFFSDVEGKVFSIEELYWIENDTLSLLTPY